MAGEISNDTELTSIKSTTLIPVVDPDEASAANRNKYIKRSALVSAINPTWPKVAYVETTGNNATAVIGDPALPFLTPQAAYNAIRAAAAGQYIIRCGVGNFDALTLTSSGTGTLIGIYGVSPTLSTLSGITGTGAAGSNGAADSNGGQGGDGISLTLSSDHSINLGVVDLSGGAGGDGGSSESGTSGGLAGNGGDLTLINTWAVSSVISGGAGGSGNSAGADSGGDGGIPGALIIRGTCYFSGDITAVSGTGGSGTTPGATPAAQATHKLSSVICEGTIELQGVSAGASYAFGYAAGKTLTAVADALLPA